MYSVSTDFRTASRSLVSNAQCMLTVGGQQVQGLTDVTINESLGNAGAFAVGMFVSTSLSFTCLTSSLLPITPSTPIHVDLGYMVGGEPEYVPMGEYYSAPKYVSHKNLLSVVQAYDRAWTLSGTFTSSLSYPTKASLVMAEIAEAQSITVAENEASARLSQVTVYEMPEGTIRDAIAGLALLIGCNVRFNRSGELEFLAVNLDETPVESYTEAHYRNDTYTLTSDEPLIYGNVSCTYTYSDTFEDYAEFYIEDDGHVYMETEEAVDDDISFTIDENGHLIMSSSDTLYDMFLDEGDLFVTHVATDAEEQDFTKTWTYSAASGSGAVNIETQNIRSQRETDRLGQYIVGASGVTYYGYTVTMFGQPQLDLGDVITVTDPNGEDYDFIVMNMVHNFTGAMTTALSAVVSDEDLSFDGSNLSGSASALAKKAQVAAVQAGIAAGNAQESADTALNLAEGTNEHFWHNETGAHITQVTQAEYKASPANAGGNTLITSNGFAVRDGTTELATFTGSGTQIGQDDQCVQITPGSIKMKLIDWYGNVREFLKFTESSGGLLRIRAPHVIGEVLQYFDTTRITETGLKIFRGKQTTEDQETCYVDLNKDGLNQMSGSGTSADPELGSTLSAGSLTGQVRYGGVTVDTVDLDFEKGTLDLTGVTSGLSVDNGITAGGHPSGLLAEDIVIGDGLIVAGGQYGTGNVSITKSGYTPLGIVGIHLENATSGGIYNTYVFTHSWYISNGKAYFIFRNTFTADAKIKVTITVLYAKT